MTKEILINVAETEESRVAVVTNNELEELYLERASIETHVGNVYKGKVVNVEASIQAAFIDFGTGKNGFLHVSDLHPKYFAKKEKGHTEKIGRRKALKDRIPIQKCLKKGSEIVVQVTKEGINTKGPTLTSYISLPGKYLVMMPAMSKHGVSHKIDDEVERTRLKQILFECKPPKDTGFIIRTAGQGCSKRDIQSDLKYLRRLWIAIEKKIKKSSAPSELYRESDLVIRTIRDIFDNKINRILCDSEPVLTRIKDFMAQAYPRLKRKAVLYKGKTPLFHKYKIEQEITKIQAREVALDGGGSVVIEQTEALVAIDVNSGKYRKQQSAEQTAYKINLVAAKEIARQLRLRDLGGLVVCDFIDMRNVAHRKELQKVFKNAVKPDRARTKILPMSRFGVIEMTRQRVRPSLRRSTYLSCPYCLGMGSVKSKESIAIEIIRQLNLVSSKKNISCIKLLVANEVAEYLQNEKRATLVDIEQQNDVRIVIKSELGVSCEKKEIICYNNRMSVVRV